MHDSVNSHLIGNYSGNENQKQESLEKFDRCLSALFEGVGTQQGFNLFLETLREEYQLLTSALVCVQDHPFKALYGWNAGYPKGMLNTLIKTNFYSLANKTDRAVAKAMSLEYGQAFSFSGGDTDYNLSDELSIASKAWAKPLGLLDSASITFSIKDNERFLFIANRHKDAGVFTEYEMGVLRRIEPHIKRAVQLHEMLSIKKAESDSIKSAIEHIPYPIALYSSLGRLFAHNEAFKSIGEQYQAYSLNTQTGQLKLCDTEAHKEFEQLMMLYFNDPDQKLRDCKTIFNKVNGTVSQINLRPMFTSTDEISSVIIEVKGPGETTEIELSKIPELIYCTESEAIVVQLLLEGQDSNEIAETLSKSVNTIRSNIKSVLAKNGYNKQIDLVRELLKHFY